MKEMETDMNTLTKLLPVAALAIAAPLALGAATQPAKAQVYVGPAAPYACSYYDPYYCPGYAYYDYGWPGYVGGGWGGYGGWGHGGWGHGGAHFAHAGHGGFSGHHR